MATITRSIIAISLILLLQSPVAEAVTADEVEALYDRSGDKLVDVEDWKQLSNQEKRDYVKSSLRAFSTHNTPPEAYRIKLYLDAITNLYHYE